MDANQQMGMLTQRLRNHIDAIDDLERLVSDMIPGVATANLAALYRLREEIRTASRALGAAAIVANTLREAPVEEVPSVLPFRPRGF